MRRALVRSGLAGILAAAAVAAPSLRSQALSAPRLDSSAVFQVVVSPGFSTDRTMFATAHVHLPTCTVATCQALFRSGDGGTTWARVGQAFPGGELLLPPQFPADRSIYSFDGTTLWRSNDGGALFLPAVPGLARAAAMLPGGAPHQAEIALAGPDRVYVYHEASHLLTLGPLYPPQRDRHDEGARPVSIAAVGPATVTLSFDGGVAGSVAAVTCQIGGRCTLAGVIRGVKGASFVAAPGAAGLATWMSQGTFERSLDGGASFALVHSSATQVWQGIAFSPQVATDHRVLVASLSMGAVAVGTVLQMSGDDGATLATLAPTGLPPIYTVGGMALRPDGVIVIGLMASAETLNGPSGPLGVWCSSDGGGSFTRC
jgi:hypothetical protein